MGIMTAATIGIIAPSKIIGRSAETEVRIQGLRIERRLPAGST